LRRFDVFYNPDPDYFFKWRSRGVLAFEMENLGLVLPGFPSHADGAKAVAAAILTVSDVLSEEATSEESYMPLDELNRSIERTIEIALEAGIAS